MIIGDSKPLEEILAMIEGREKVLVLGCRGCVTVCNVGGEKEVGILATALRIARKKAGQAPSVEEMTLERQCDPEYIEELAEVAEDYDAIISIACGVGPQFVSERFPGVACLPGHQHHLYRRGPGARDLGRALPELRQLPGAQLRRALPHRPL